MFETILNDDKTSIDIAKIAFSDHLFIKKFISTDKQLTSAERKEISTELVRTGFISSILAFAFAFGGVKLSGKICEYYKFTKPHSVLRGLFGVFSGYLANKAYTEYRLYRWESAYSDKKNVATIFSLMKEYRDEVSYFKLIPYFNNPTSDTNNLLKALKLSARSIELTKALDLYENKNPNKNNLHSTNIIQNKSENTKNNDSHMVDLFSPDPLDNSELLDSNEPQKNSKWWKPW